MPVTADSSGGVSLYVNYDELHSLARTLAGIATTFDQGGLYGIAISDPYVAAAVEQVQRDWSRARATIRDFLQDASEAVESAATGYQQADQGICGAAR